MRVPNHLGVIPDGNRRWAKENGLSVTDGYVAGVETAITMLKRAVELGIPQITAYGFTKENTKRKMAQRLGYTNAILALVDQLNVLENVSIRVYGDTNSTVFPESLIPYTKLNIDNGNPVCRVNILVNYNYKWDISTTPHHTATLPDIDLVARWGGRTRLSGFLPIQCAYADIRVIDSLWPDAVPSDLDDALRWYGEQDVTKGG